MPASTFSCNRSLSYCIIFPRAPYQMDLIFSQRNFNMNVPPLLAKTAGIAVLIATLGMSPKAEAAVILTFGQTSNSPTVTATSNAAHTQTALSGTGIAVTISQFAGAGAPISAFLNLNLLSNGAATPFSGSVIQSFAGSASFTSLAGGGGINYLTANFTDFVFGAVGGSSLTLSASEPPGTVSFTSSVLPSSILGDPRALSFGLADVTAPVAIVGSTLQGFTASISGTVSAAAVAVPEPASLAMLGAGLVALGVIRRRDRTYA
jgi:hypothetical protein